MTNDAHKNRLPASRLAALACCAAAVPVFWASALAGAASPAAAGDPVAKMICPAGKKDAQTLRLQEALASIAAGGSPDAVLQDGKTALHLAAMQQNHLTLCWLIAKGADLQAMDDAGKRFYDYLQPEEAVERVKTMCGERIAAIGGSASRDWEHIIAQMSDENAPPSMAPTRFAPYMLALAVRSGGMDVNRKTAEGTRWLVHKGMDPTLGRLLLALGWRAESPTPAHRLLYAVLRNDVKAAKALLKKHAGLLATEGYDLLAAAQSAAMLKALLAAGADVKAQPAKPWCEHQLLLDAITKGANESVVTALLKAGAGMPLEVSTQSTGLHYACGDPYVPANVVTALVKAGANANAQNTTGHTPLHVAAIMGNLPAVEALVALGADTSLKNDKGLTPAQVIGLGSSVSAALRKRIAEALDSPHTEK